VSEGHSSDTQARRPPPLDPVRKMLAMTPRPTQEKRLPDEAELRQIDGAYPQRGGGRPSLPPGQVIKGRYRVVRRLGAGRWGRVYLAEDVTTGKQMALKVFHRELAKDEEFVTQLLRQAKVAAALSENQPHIVTVYECDQAEDGSVFIVMEYLNGRSLQDMIRRQGPLDIPRALRLAGQIVEGLQAAHGMGLVHADLRPHDVFVLAEGEEEAIKLKGFEVAGLREAGLMDHLMRAGVIPGTPEYRAPEQIEGGEVTSRTDIYAFGVLLYEMLTGVVPFTAPTPDGVLAMQLQETPAPLRLVRPEIPSVVGPKVQQALEKEPEKRQRFIGDVLNEYLYELAIDEYLTEKARQRYGVLWNGITMVHACIARAKEIATDPERVGARWMVLVGVVALVMASVSTVWMFSLRQAPTGGYTPLPLQPPGETPPRERTDWSRSGTGVLEPSRPSQAAKIPLEAPNTKNLSLQRPEEARAPELGGRTESGTKAIEPSRLSLPGRIPPKTPEAKSPPQRSVRSPARIDTPTSGGGEANLPRIAGTPSTPPREASRRQEESPDPTAIIDWLLEQSPAKER
jgi:predicted Ser/Thr protein kinase